MTAFIALILATLLGGSPERAEWVQVAPQFDHVESVASQAGSASGVQDNGSQARISNGF